MVGGGGDMRISLFASLLAMDTLPRSKVYTVKFLDKYYSTINSNELRCTNS